MAHASMNMAASLGITSTEPHELKLGASFGNQGPLYHTLRYDFKPASVDTHKVATVEVNEKNPKEVMVTVPHNDGAGTPHTVFRGNQCPIKRDCVLIINKTTGEMTIEKLHTSITVKKTRFESVTAKLAPPLLDPLSLGRKPSPKHREGRGRASPKPSSLGCIPKHSPLHASPNASLPMIGEDIDPGYDDPRPNSQPYQPSKNLADVIKHDRDNDFKPTAQRSFQDLSQQQHERESFKYNKPTLPNSKRIPLKSHDRDLNNKSSLPNTGTKSRSPEIASRPRSPEIKQRSPDIKSRSPDVKMRSPDVKMRSPDVKMRSPDIKMRSPDVKQRSPDISISFEPKEQDNSRKPFIDDMLLNSNEIDSMVGVLSDSESSDSSSDSGSESGSSDGDTPRTKPIEGPNEISFAPSAQVLLSDDLQLSDSGSDSD